MRGGAFDFAWPALGDRSYSYYDALTFFDQAVDGACDAGETVLLARIPNPFQLGTKAATLTLTAADLARFAASCELWTH